LAAILRICDYLFVLRPVILIPAWSFYLIGAAEGARSTGASFDGIPGPFEAFCLTAILATAYLLNQIFDRESDERNNKCLYLSRGIFRPRTLVLMAFASFLVASWAFHRTEGEAKGPLVLALALSLAYSLPPARLCARPFFDLISNSIGYGGIAFILGFAVFDVSRQAAIWGSIPWVLLVGATFLHTTILDFSGDRAAGKKSTTVLIGIRASAVTAAVLNGCAFVFALAAGQTPAAVVTGVTLPVTVFPLFKRSIGTSSFVIQTNTLVVTAAAAFAWPPYLVVVVPLILLSRFYHRRRFGFTYPGPARVV
jgi:4-hydroxybenzoate polyprenyltransferase